jgi:VanZ family protein
LKRLLLLFWILVITILSLYPVQNQTSSWWQHTDKAVHIVMYLVLSVFIINTLTHRNRLLIALIISVLFGIVIEALQEVMGLGRQFSIFDILANFLGASLGLTGYYFIKNCTDKAP